MNHIPCPAFAARDFVPPTPAFLPNHHIPTRPPSKRWQQWRKYKKEIVTVNIACQTGQTSIAVALPLLLLIDKRIVIHFP